MSNFIFIFTSIIIPIFIQIAIGFVMQKKFSLNINTLSKLQLYVLVPSLMFVKIYDSQLSEKLFISIMLYSLSLFAVLYLISWSITKIYKYPKSSTSSFINSVVFYNSGNYCIPLVQLLYANNPFAMSVQIIVMMTQNIVTNTVGIFNTSVGSRSWKHALLEVFKIPMGYGVLAGILFKALNLKVWTPVWSSLDILGQGMVPIALFTLGAQLANTKFTFKIPKAYLSNFIRLILSPLLAYLMVKVTGATGIVAQVIVISSAAPTAVNTVLLAIEYDNEPDFASQSVFSSTVFSAVTVSAVIYLIQNLIPA